MIKCPAFNTVWFFYRSLKNVIKCEKISIFLTVPSRLFRSIWRRTKFWHTLNNSRSTRGASLKVIMKIQFEKIDGKIYWTEAFFVVIVCHCQLLELTQVVFSRESKSLFLRSSTERRVDYFRTRYHYSEHRATVSKMFILFLLLVFSKTLLLWRLLEQFKSSLYYEAEGSK